MAFSFGNAISSVGTHLGLPDLGLGKLLGGSNSLPGALQGTNPLTYAGIGGAAPDPRYGSNQPLKAPITIADPGTPSYTDPGTSGGSTGSYSGGYTTTQSVPTYALDGQINSALGRLPQQQQIGQSNILNSYNSALAQLTGGKAAAHQQFDQTRNQAQNDNLQARGQIDNSVHTQAAGLQRLLGAHGAGNSSAAFILAPFAAALQGNQQRSQVQNAYGRNMGALDQSVATYDTNEQNAEGQLNAQKQQNENQLLQNIDSTKAQLLGQLSNSGQNQGTINALLDQINQLGLNPTFTPKTPDVVAPNLDQYNYDPTQGAQLGAGGQDPATAGLGAYWSLLSDSQKKQKAGLGA